MNLLKLSPLGHLWLIDIDGTILRHNGHIMGSDEVLPGVADFWKEIPSQDMIILLSAREEHFRDETLALITRMGLRFDQALFGIPTGERILINDAKPSGLKTALSVNLLRDQGLERVQFIIDENL